MKLRSRFPQILAFGLLLTLTWGQRTPSSTMPFAPPPDGAGSHSFSFIVYGDIQGNYRKGHDALVKHMIQEEADLVFNTGDIFRDKGKHYDRDFYPVIEKLARRMPFFPAVGNHDVNWESRGVVIVSTPFFAETSSIWPVSRSMNTW